MLSTLKVTYIINSTHSAPSVTFVFSSFDHFCFQFIHSFIVSTHQTISLTNSVYSILNLITLNDTYFINSSEIQSSLMSISVINSMNVFLLTTQLTFLSEIKKIYFAFNSPVHFLSATRPLIFSTFNSCSLSVSNSPPDNFCFQLICSLSVSNSPPDNFCIQLICSLFVSNLPPDNFCIQLICSLFVSNSPPDNICFQLNRPITHVNAQRNMQS